MSTNPSAYTDAKWAAREARRLALEEAAALCLRVAEEIDRHDAVLNEEHRERLRGRANAVRLCAVGICQLAEKQP